jgi:molybdopterin converting factor small subunit
VQSRLIWHHVASATIPTPFIFLLARHCQSPTSPSPNVPLYANLHNIAGFEATEGVVATIGAGLEALRKDYSTLKPTRYWCDQQHGLNVCRGVSDPRGTNKQLPKTATGTFNTSPSDHLPLYRAARVYLSSTSVIVFLSHSASSSTFSAVQSSSKYIISCVFCR